MRGNKGGMQTAAANYSIYCKKCGKPAYRKEAGIAEMRYYHFTKNGSVCHTVKNEVKS